MTKEADDGMHVVLVTAEVRRDQSQSACFMIMAQKEVSHIPPCQQVKKAQKYGLQELPVDAMVHTVTLGSAGPIEIPLASLREVVKKERMEKEQRKYIKRMDERSESDSEDEEDCRRSNKASGEMTKDPTLDLTKLSFE